MAKKRKGRTSYDTNGSRNPNLRVSVLLGADSKRLVPNNKTIFWLVRCTDFVSWNLLSLWIQHFTVCEQRCQVPVRSRVYTSAISALYYHALTT